MKCSFCDTDLRPGTGLILIKNDGKIIAYCSTKCKKNSKLRSPRKVKWLTKQKKEKKDSKAGKKVETKKKDEKK